jgi:hypothetical protein
MDQVLGGRPSRPPNQRTGFWPTAAGDPDSSSSAVAHVRNSTPLLRDSPCQFAMITATASAATPTIMTMHTMCIAPMRNLAPHTSLATKSIATNIPAKAPKASPFGSNRSDATAINAPNIDRAAVLGRRPALDRLTPPFLIIFREPRREFATLPPSNVLPCSAESRGSDKPTIRPIYMSGCRPFGTDDGNAKFPENIVQFGPFLIGDVQRRPRAHRSAPEYPGTDTRHSRDGCAFLQITTVAHGRVMYQSMWRHGDSPGRQASPGTR